MLTITRKRDEQIIIDDPQTDYVITITIKDVRRNQVRLGIEAPRQVQVDRLEVYKKREDVEVEPRSKA